MSPLDSHPGVLPEDPLQWWRWEHQNRHQSNPPQPPDDFDDFVGAQRFWIQGTTEASWPATVTHSAWRCQIIPFFGVKKSLKPSVTCTHYVKPARQTRTLYARTETYNDGSLTHCCISFHVWAGPLDAICSNLSIYLPEWKYLTAVFPKWRWWLARYFNRKASIVGAGGLKPCKKTAYLLYILLFDDEVRFVTKNYLKHVIIRNFESKLGFFIKQVFIVKKLWIETETETWPSSRPRWCIDPAFPELTSQPGHFSLQAGITGSQWWMANKWQGGLMDHLADLSQFFIVTIWFNLVSKHLAAKKWQKCLLLLRNEAIHVCEDRDQGHWIFDPPDNWKSSTCWAEADM